MLDALAPPVEDLGPSVEASGRPVADRFVLQLRDAAIGVAGAARLESASLAGGPVAILDLLLSRTLPS